MILCRFETVGMFYWGVPAALMRVCACHFQFQTTSTQMKHCCLFKVEYVSVFLTRNEAWFAKLYLYVCIFFNYLPWNHYWTSNPIVMPVIVSTEILQLAWLAGGRPFEVSVDVQLANNPLILKASSICYLKRAENSVVVTKFLCGHFVCGTYTFRGNNFEWSQVQREPHDWFCPAFS